MCVDLFFVLTFSKKVGTITSMERKTPELSIVLPTYKEKENLAVFVPQIEAEFRNVPIEIIVVDDNSRDGTRELTRRLNEIYRNITLLERPALLGIGSALRDGYNKARGEYILSSDADSFTTKDMRSLYEKIRAGFDLVLGYRVTYASADGGGSGHKTVIAWLETFVISPLSNWIIRTVSGIRLRNYNTNFRVIRSSVWKNILTVENRQFFLFETIFRAKQKGARIAEIPAIFYPRKFGESKVSFFRQAPKYLLKLIRYTVFDRPS